MVLDFVVIVVGLLALVWSADQFVEGAAAIAGSVGMPPLLIGMTIVSVGTSAPEILVSLMAAIAGSGELAVGNALGSNIANIGLVLGITLLISPILVGRTTAFIDLPILIGVIILCGVSLADAVLSIVDASLLMGALVLYLLRIGSHLRRPDPNDTPPELPTMPLARALGAFLIGLVILIASSRALVWASVNVAQGFGVSELLIGLTIVAFGTSLPELAASVVSALRGHA
ncbi:MAG: sodium:calcium antiporter, partial [Luminiphilus sp.]